MEKNIAVLFDMQRFSGNKRLADVIASVENRYPKELPDDDLMWVNAAGEITPGKPLLPDKKDKQHE